MEAAGFYWLAGGSMMVWAIVGILDYLLFGRPRLRLRRERRRWGHTRWYNRR